MNARCVVRIRACYSSLKKDRDETSLLTGSSNAACKLSPGSQLRTRELPGQGQSAPKFRTLPGLRLLEDAGARLGWGKSPFLVKREDALPEKRMMDNVLPLGQWVCFAPNHCPTLKPCFLMLGLKRPQTVMEICHHSQILLYMEAVCPICAGDELLLDRRAGQCSDPNTLASSPPGPQERVCGQPLCCAGTG